MRVIDCMIHPYPASPAELLAFLPEPWRTRGLHPRDARLYREWFPDDDPGTVPPGARYACTDIAFATHELFDVWGLERAVLLPLSPGLVASGEHGSAIATAINQWQVETWLATSSPAAGRCCGSIRVFPEDPVRAVQEIERWAGDRRFVQVAVPFASRAPYGQERYFPVWEAAARHRLPVVIHRDDGTGVEFPPTMTGYPSRFVEYYTVFPANAMIHVTSLICEGVFERLPDSLFILGDGGFDFALALTWRLNKEWRACRQEVPWVTRQPREYIRDHIRFVLRSADGPDSAGAMGDVLDMMGGDVVLYGSGYPRWDRLAVSDALDRVPQALQPGIMAGNAAAVYGL